MGDSRGKGRRPPRGRQAGMLVAGRQACTIHLDERVWYLRR